MNPKKREANRRVSEKISVLRREGDDPKQAIAKALNMERKGRLRRGGKYVHVGKHKRKRQYKR